MVAEELSQRFFSRDRVRNRMLKRAAEVWGFAESEIEDFDPLVSLLIESCSVEFEKIAGEIGQSQNRMLERIAQLLYPGTITVHPAYGILQAMSSESVAYLHKEAQFIYRQSGNDRKSENANLELFFSPSHKTKIVDGAIRYIASSREMFGLREGNQKLPVASATRKQIEFQNSVFLGLELNEDVHSLDGISFFFNWINQQDSRDWLQNLAYTEWTIDGTRLNYKIGFDNLED